MAATALETPIADANLPGTPVIADEDLPKVEEKKEKKEKKDKKEKKEKKDKKDKKEKKSKKDKKEKSSDNEDATSSDSSEKKEKEPKAVRQAVGVIVIDPTTQNVLLLGSRKKEGTFVLPRDDCQAEEHPEKAALRLLNDKAGVTATFLSNRVGSYSESNKKGKVIAQHWMYEVNAPNLLESWPESERQRVWVSYEDALKATESKRMSQVALQKCSLAKN